MDENTQKDTAQVAPEQPEKEITPEVEQDATQATPTTPSSSEEDVEKQESGEAQSDTPDAKWENDKRSMSEKIKKLENEKNEYQQAKALVDILDEAAREDPDFMKLANKKLVEKGYLDESVLQQLDSQPQTQSAGQHDNPVIQWAQSKMQEEKAKEEKFYEDFETRHSDIAEGEKDLVRANRTAIAAAAKRNANKGMSREDAFELAYKQIMSPESLVEDGKLKGLAQAQGASPTEQSASGGSANTGQEVTLSSDEKRVADQMGVSYAEYAKNKA